MEITAAALTTRLARISLSSRSMLKVLCPLTACYALKKRGLVSCHGELLPCVLQVHLPPLENPLPRRLRPLRPSFVGLRRSTSAIAPSRPTSWNSCRKNSRSGSQSSNTPRTLSTSRRWNPAPATSFAWWRTTKTVLVNPANPPTPYALLRGRVKVSHVTTAEWCVCYACRSRRRLLWKLCVCHDNHATATLLSDALKYMFCCQVVTDGCQ